MNTINTVFPCLIVKYSNKYRYFSLLYRILCKIAPPGGNSAPSCARVRCVNYRQKQKDPFLIFSRNKKDPAQIKKTL